MRAWASRASLVGIPMVLLGLARMRSSSMMAERRALLLSWHDRLPYRGGIPRRRDGGALLIYWPGLQFESRPSRAISLACASDSSDTGRGPAYIPVRESIDSSVGKPSRNLRHR